MTNQYGVQLQSGVTQKIHTETAPTLIKSGEIEALTFMGAAIHVLVQHLDAPEVWVRQELVGSQAGMFGLYSLRFHGITYLVEVWERVKEPVKV